MTPPLIGHTLCRYCKQPTLSGSEICLPCYREHLRPCRCRSVLFALADRRKRKNGMYEPLAHCNLCKGDGWILT